MSRQARVIVAAATALWLTTVVALSKRVARLHRHRPPLVLEHVDAGMP